jgi:hypothetical protein
LRSVSPFDGEDPLLSAFAGYAEAAAVSVEVFFADCVTEEFLPMPPSLKKSSLYRSEISR